jgi:hypothetical protein
MAMRRVSLTLLLVLACSPPDSSPVAGRIPPALAPAFALLDSALSPASRDSLRRLLPDSVSELHFSLGMWLRNNGGLWKGGPVADSLRARGVTHPDDMSHLILTAYGFYLRGQRVPLDSLIRAVPPLMRPEDFPVISPSRDPG